MYSSAVTFITNMHCNHAMQPFAATLAQDPGGKTELELHGRFSSSSSNARE